MNRFKFFPTAFIILTLIFAIEGTSRATGNETIIFLHHSTGYNVYNEGHVAQWFDDYNAAHLTDYQINERAYPTSPYPWDNYPYDYWNLWATVDGSGNPRTPACNSNDHVFKHQHKCRMPLF